MIRSPRRSTVSRFTSQSTGDSRAWSERDELRHELEDILINTLEWADIPTEPDPTTYVDDDHFQVEASDVDIGRRSDPTPGLEVQQETMLLRVLEDVTPTGTEVLETVATDGKTHYRDLRRCDRQLSINDLSRPRRDERGREIRPRDGQVHL